MSFLVPNEQDFVKMQLRDMLLRPNKRKEIKTKFKKLGLYNYKEGFLHYKDFFLSELPSFDRETLLKTRKHKRTMTQGFASTRYTRRGVVSSISPNSRGQALNRTRVGLTNTRFFKKDRLAVVAGTLYILFSKFNPLEGPAFARSPILDSSSPRKVAVLRKDFIYAHISAFLHVASHLNSLLPNTSIPISLEIKKNIQAAFANINLCTPKKPSIKQRDQRLLNYLNQREFSSILAEPLNRFFFKRYPTFNDQFFEEFISTYIMTNIVSNQHKLCFEIYDRTGTGNISAKNVFSYFESPFFQFIKHDVFAICNGINPPNKNEEEIKKIVKFSNKMTSIPGEEIDELHVTFKEFVKLPFTQKFPDLLFAIAHFLLGDFATSFLCNYFNLHKYRVITQDQQITIRRVPKTILNYPRIIDTQWIILKQEIKSSKLKPDLSYSLLKGIVSSFLLACEIEAACTYRIFNCTSASLKEASYIILGKYCPTLMQGIFDHMTDNNSANVGVLEFIDYFEGFFKVNHK